MRPDGTAGSGLAKPTSRDDRIPRDVLYRVMPKVETVDLEPREPTLLEKLTQGFYEEQSTGDVSTRIKDDGKRR